MNLFTAVLLALIFYTAYKLAKFVWMKWFDSTLMCYSVRSMLHPDEPATPFEFIHNCKRYKVFVVHEEFKNEMLGTTLSRSNVFIDEMLVLMISRMKGLVLVRRSVDMDLQYANSDIFKILRWARVYWRKRFGEEYKKHTEGIRLTQSR